MPPNESRHYKWRRISFYAQRGMITVVDEDLAADSKADAHEAIKRIRPGEFMKRVISVRMAIGDKYPDEMRKANRLLDQATEVCKIAKAQGDPGDPSVLDHFRNHARRSSIMLPSDVNNQLGPIGGAKFKVNLGNPRKMLLEGVQVVPDLTLGNSSMITPAVAEQMRKTRAARR